MQVHRPDPHRYATLFIFALLLLRPAPAVAQEQPWLRSIEELMQIEVTSAAKREHRLADTAAAVFVLTRDDIRRSGMTTVPDLLRLVPGAQVAQIDGNKWAVSVRGFNSRWANKLLVMVNGRSIYSRLFSGVFWDSISIPVSEIERIEVVRGPGGSVWGANAVNGVINIITRTPQTEEITVSGTGGSLGATSAGVQYAAPLSDWFRLHAYVDASRQGSFEGSVMHIGRDDRRDLRVGVGTVMDASSRDQVRLEVRGFDGENWSVADESLSSSVVSGRQYAPRLSDSTEYTGALQWTRNVPGLGSLDTAASYETVHRDEGVLHIRGRLFEASFQHSVPRKGRHEVTWGLLTQFVAAPVTGAPSFRLTEHAANDSMFGALVQDEIGFAGDRFTLTLGAKVERLETTGWYAQPTLRARWRPTAQQSVWGAVSRAVRTPSLIERGLDLEQVAGTMGGQVVVAHVAGNSAMGAESLQAREAGYRWAAQRLSIDLAAYHNRYSGLTSLEAGQQYITPGPEGLRLVFPFMFNNLGHARSAGVEALTTVTATSWWRFVGGYSLFTVKAGLNSETSLQYDGDTPRHQGTLRSMFSLPHRVEVDTLIGLVGALERMDIPAYARVDMRLGWRSRNGLDLSVVLQNVLDSNHYEFEGAGPSQRLALAYVVPTPMPRRVWAAATWRF